MVIHTQQKKHTGLARPPTPGKFSPGSFLPPPFSGTMTGKRQHARPATKTGKRHHASSSHEGPALDTVELLTSLLSGQGHLPHAKVETVLSLCDAIHCAVALGLHVPVHKVAQAEITPLIQDSLTTTSRSAASSSSSSSVQNLPARAKGAATVSRSPSPPRTTSSPSPPPPAYVATPWAPRWSWGRPLRWPRLPLRRYP